jgi:hypothetical protein
MRTEQYDAPDLHEQEEIARAAPGVACQLSIAAMLFWSLLETHWELQHAMGFAHAGLIVFVKLIVAGIAIAALRGSAIALAACAFWCVVGIVMIGVTLPDLYSLSRTFFYLSLLEVVFKTTAVVAISFFYAEDRIVRDDEHARWQVR